MDNSNSSFNNVTNDILKIEADVYFDIAEKLMEENNMFAAENLKAQKDAIRALVTSAIYGYSAELYFKFIISQFGETPPKGHDLQKIYNNIKSEECLKFFEATFTQYFEKNTEFLNKGLIGTLKEVQNNFIDHRYIAERVKSGNYFAIRLDYNYLLFGYMKEMTDEWLKIKYRD